MSPSKKELALQIRLLLATGFNYFFAAVARADLMAWLTVFHSPKVQPSRPRPVLRPLRFSNDAGR